MGVICPRHIKKIFWRLQSRELNSRIPQQRLTSILKVPKNKPCKRNNRQISDNTKIAAKQGNAEERPDAGCEIKWWKAAAEMSSFFNIPPDISKADKPQGFGDRVPDSRQAANLSSKYIAN